MPKRLKQQRRGKAHPKYRAPSHRYKSKTRYRTYDEAEKSGKVQGFVEKLFHDPARSAPVMRIRFPSTRAYLAAPEGIIEGQSLEQGKKADIRVGNILPLNFIPEGSIICNVEIVPGDGGRIVKSAGSSARLVSKDDVHAIIKLPSKKFKSLNLNCRAMIGTIAGGGRRARPMAKAGKKFHCIRSKAKIWPIVAGTCMNPVDHPHGGGKRRQKKKKTVSRRASPGQKVGSIAARRTGRKKGKVVVK